MHVTTNSQQKEKEKEYDSLTFKHTLKLLDQCQHMLISQRDTYKKQLDANRHVSQIHLTQIQQLKDQMELANKEVAALKQLNATLGKENNSLQQQQQLPSHDNGLNHDSRNYERFRQLVMEDVLNIPSERHALLKDDELIKRINTRFQEQNQQVSTLKTTANGLNNQLATAKKEAAEATAVTSIVPSSNRSGSYTITHQQLVEMERIKKEMQKKINEQNQQLNTLQTQNTSLLTQAREAGRIASDNIELRTETDQLKGDIAVYKANIVALKTTRNLPTEEQKKLFAMQDTKIEQLEEEVKRWKKEAERTKTDYELTRETLQLAVRNVSSAGREALKEAESKIAQYEDALDRQERRYNQLVNSKSTHKASDETQRKIKDFQNTENQLRDANNRNKAIIVGLRSKLAEYERTRSRERDILQSPAPSSSNSKRSSPNESVTDSFSKKSRWNY